MVGVMHGWQSESTDGPKGGWSRVFWNGCHGCSGHLNSAPKLPNLRAESPAQTAPKWPNLKPTPSRFSPKIAKFEAQFLPRSSPKMSFVCVKGLRLSAASLCVSVSPPVPALTRTAFHQYPIHNCTRVHCLDVSGWNKSRETELQSTGTFVVAL